jgi:hypothetical protein
MARPLAALVAFLLCITAVSARAQAPLEVTTGAGDRRPVVRLQGVLQDRGLRDALASGLPLRFHLRVELWEDAFFDRLAEAQELSVMLLQDPLDGSLVLTTPHTEQRFASLSGAEAAIQSEAAFAMRPRRSGRFYYLATLDVATLSLSDLEELRRWLRGDAAPAVQGRRPVGRAVERGLRRTVVRLLGLPTRRLTARTVTFAVP